MKYTNEELEMTELIVGKKFKLFGGDSNINKEGAYFEALESKQGYALTIYLKNMKSREKRELRNSTMRTRIYKEGNKALILIRYGISPLIFDVSFDPTLYTDDRALQLTLDNHIVKFIGIESTTNIIQTLRVANFPQKLKMILVPLWSKAFDEENYSEDYSNWVTKVYNQYTTLELWEKGEDVGYFGEEYQY